MPTLGSTQSARQSKSKSRKPSTTVRRMRDLSARDGRIILAEYLVSIHFMIEIVLCFYIYFIFIL